VSSIAMTGSTKNRSGAPALFTAHEWSRYAITLVADTVKTPPFAPNRFTFRLERADRLTMRWEVARNGAWALGDSLVCARSA
jgi:hypothetical protein